jgi:hypothetical protein
MISKMKIGGKKIGAVTKNTIDKLGSSDPYKRHSGEKQDSPVPYSPGRASQESRAEIPRRDTFEEVADTRGREYGYTNDGQPVGLGLSAPPRPYAGEASPQSPSSFASFSQGPPQVGRSESYAMDNQRPHTPMSPGTVISKKEKDASRHGFSASTSGGKVSKLFKTDGKSKRHSDTPGYSPPTDTTSPKQKSKFSKFVGDLAQSSITGTKIGHGYSSSQSNIGASPPPPPPPDKAQFRSASDGTALKGFMSDLASRDITGGRPRTPSQPYPGQSSQLQSSAPLTNSEDRPSGGGFSRFISDLNKRDITGASEQNRLAAQRRREQETHQNMAKPKKYDDTASDWDVKITQMEDVLPHIRRELLAESLIQAGGDEQRAIGLAVINSR